MKKGINILNAKFNNAFYIHQKKEKRKNTHIYIESNKKGIKEIIEIKSKCDKVFHENINKKIIIKLNSENDFIFQIAKIRSLKIILQTVFPKINFKNQIFIICKIKNNKKCNQYENLIRYSYQSLSAILGGVNTIESNTQKNNFVQHEINQQLILKH